MKDNQFCKDLRCVRTNGVIPPCNFVKENGRYYCRYQSGYYDCIYLSKEGKIREEYVQYSSGLYRDTLTIISALVRHERQNKGI